MPVNREYSSSTSSLNRLASLSMMGTGDDDPLFVSTPNINNSSHTRSSSTDSMDGYPGNHSRQSSDSTVEIPTRTLNTKRKVSTSADPLQFIKTKSSDYLAKKAQQQIKIAEETKTMRSNPDMAEMDDWQSNFANWRTRRRRKSEATMQRVEETDKIHKENEEEDKKPKTFGQMMEDRNRRKSTGRLALSAYPIDDDNDDLFTTPLVKETQVMQRVSQVESSVPLRNRAGMVPKLTRDARSKSMGSLGNSAYIHYDDTKKASWAGSSSDEDSDKKDNSGVSERLTDNGDKDTSSVPRRRTGYDAISVSNNVTSEPSRKQGATPNKSANSSTKISNILNRFENKEDVTNVDYKKPKESFKFNTDSNSASAKRAAFTSPSSSFSFSAPEKAESANSPRSRITVQTKPVPTKASVEKVIKISQKPNNERGFGFTFSGGADKKAPICVQKVSLGSAADVNEVLVKDELLSINGRDLSMLAHAQVQKIIDDSVKTGQLQLKVRRHISDGEEEFSSSGEEEEKSPKLPSALSPRQKTPPSHPPKQETWKASVSTTPSSDRSYSRTSRASPSETLGSERSATETRFRSNRFSRDESPVSKVTETKDKTVSPLQRLSNLYSSTSEESFTTPSPQHNQMESRKMPSIENDTRSSNNKQEQRDKSKETNNNEINSSKDSEFHQETPEITPKHSTVSHSKPIARERVSVPVHQEPKSTKHEEIPIEEEVVVPVKKEVEASIPSLEVTITERPTLTRSREENKPQEVQQFKVDTSAKSSAKWQPPPLESNEPPVKTTPDRWEPPVPAKRATSPVKTTPVKWEPPVPAASPVEEQSDDSAGGPPAILRRWQQKKTRPRSDYSSSSSVDSAIPPWETPYSLGQHDRRITPDLSPSQPESSSTFPLPQATVGQQVTVEIPDTLENSITKENSDSMLNTAPMQQTSQFELPLDSQHQPRPLMIDPRNQVSPSETNLPQYNFHVNIQKSSDTEPVMMMSAAETIEMERQKIQEEAERRLEEQRQQWEEEEKRRIKEREDELRRKEEELQQEKERLKEEQERMKREREELEKKKINETKEAKIQPKTFNVRQNSPKTFTATLDTSQGPSLRKLDTSWPPPNSDNLTSKSKQILTREDMMAMNRKPTPLQRKPEIENDNEVSSEVSVSRDTPSKQDLHNLNAVPKPKFRSSKEWIAEKEHNSEHSRSDKSRASPNVHEHWLVEEAERRRKEQNRNSAIFPSHNSVRPASDKKWRDDSHVPKSSVHSNVLSQPRPLNSHSNGQYSQQQNKSMSQTLPHNFNFNSVISPKKEPPVPPKPTRTSSSSSASSPSSPLNPSEQFMAVSGKQGCSHCQQELGFGAAMVIESLGLYYHVQCFRCCVCHTALGNGSQGADVRVRVNKLHCRNCYSNDEGVRNVGRPS